MSVRQLLREFDSAELAEWRAYYEIEPFGELIADQRHGIAVAALANVNRDAKRRPEPYRATDFIYWHESHREPGAILKADPDEQSKLITRTLFGR